MLDNEQVNNIEPVWMMEKNKITDEMHTDFFFAFWLATTKVIFWKKFQKTFKTLINF